MSEDRQAVNQAAETIVVCVFSNGLIYVTVLL